MVDFLGIGVQKAGTSWLHKNLASHPEVWLPFIKEVHFFNRRFIKDARLERLRRGQGFGRLRLIRRIRLRIRKLRRGETVSQFGKDEEIAYLKRLADRDFFLTPEWYDFLFSPAPRDRKTGEITPYYCALEEDAIADLKQRYPAARLLYLIRDPVDRALSSLRMVASRTGVDMNDPAAVRRLAKRCLASERFNRRGDFRAHIPLWDRHFGDQVLYLPFGRIRTDPERLLRSVEAFIGIGPFGEYPSLYQAVHATRKSGAIPEEIRRRFAEINSDQYAFLESRFSPDFLDELH